MIIHGRRLSKAEVVDFVTGYKRKVESEPKGRYCRLIHLVPSQSRIIDLGCGWGTFSKMMEEKGNIVLGIDNSENEIEICKTVWGDTETLKFECKEIYDIENKSFDCVVSTQVIEHVHNPGNYLHQCNRVLRNGGLLIISVPNVMNPRFFVRLKGRRRNSERSLIARSQKINNQYVKSRDHIQAWDPPHFVTLVSTVGFVLEKYEPMEGIPMPSSWKLFPRYIQSEVFLRLFGNYSYTMAFLFRKIRKSSMRNSD